MKLTHAESNKLGRLATERANAQGDFAEVCATCGDTSEALEALSAAEDAFYNYLDNLTDDTE